MSKKSKREKKLFTYVYASVPEGREAKKLVYKEKKKDKTEFEYISKKTYKKLCDEVNEYNTNLVANEQPRILKVEGFTKAKKSKRKKDALLRLDYKVEKVGENGETEIINNHYEFDVSSRRAFANKTKGYFFSTVENAHIAITRSYLIPLILVLATVIGVGGYGVYHYIVPLQDEKPVSEFNPDIDENINQKQETPEGYKQEGIKVEGFSKWTVEAGKTEDIPIPLRNPAGNPCYFTFEITLNKTKEVLYKSKMVPPGEGIGKIDLNKALENGVYDVTIMIYTNELESGGEMNSAQLDVEMTVA